MIAAANATELFTANAIGAANIIVDSRPDPSGGPQAYARAGDAATLLGVTVFAPPSYERVLVWPDQITGKPSRWEIDISDTITLVPAPLPPDAVILQRGGVTSLTHFSLNGRPATYVQSNGTSTLYFLAGGNALSVSDRSGSAAKMYWSRLRLPCKL